MNVAYRRTFMYAKHTNLLTRTHLFQSQYKIPWITFRGHSRSHILGSLAKPSRDWI